MELKAGATVVPCSKRARIFSEVDSSLVTEVSKSSNRVSVVTSEVTERSLEGYLRMDLVEVEYVRGVVTERLSLELVTLVVFKEMSSLKSK